MQSKCLRTFWRSLVIGGVAMALALPATAAFGGTLSHRDPAHDVTQETAMDGNAPAPDNKTVDIVHVRFAHTSRRVVAVVRLRDLVGKVRGFDTFIKVPRRTYQLIPPVPPEIGSPFWTLAKRSTGEEVPCDGLSVRAQPAKNTIRASVPTSCLNRPRWVQMDATSSEWPAGADFPFFDDAMRTGRGLGQPTFSRRIFTG
jgi:hypothetical protein